MKIEKSWRDKLSQEIGKEYIVLLKKFLQEERGRSLVYPPEEEVFSAFRYAPYDAVKVVILGQDPYHGKGQAHGLSFSVKKGVKIPPSLKNIYKELKSDVGIEEPSSGCLECWARQGVLLLNATLTVRDGEPKSHYGQGWEIFTDAVVSLLCEREDPIVFLLWGKSAQEKCERIFDVKKHPHVVLKANHPSPYSASKFFGCKHFSKTNEVLKGLGKEPIDWGVG